MGNKPQTRLLIAGGGTGGHLFPGIAIAQALEKKIPLEIRFVGTASGIETKTIPAMGLHLYQLQVSGLYGVGKIKKIVSLLKLPIAFLQSIWILLTYRPHLVLGVGGYASGPMLLVAFLLGFKIALQEQNASPGITNKFLGRFAPLTLAPFTGLEGIFKNPVVIGNPIRKEIIQAAAIKRTKNRSLFNNDHSKRHHFPEAEHEPQPSPSDTKTAAFLPGNAMDAITGNDLKLKAAKSNEAAFHIAIVGGSQGARVINRAFCGLLEKLKDKEVKITHQAGKWDLEEVKSAYNEHQSLKAEVSVFIEDMAGLYQEVDLLISRSGSMVAEFIAMGKASILVPIPQASGDHQKQNALKLVEKGAAKMIEQKDLNPETLWAAINQLWENPTELTQMEQAAKAMYSGDAADLGASTLIDFFKLDQNS